MGVSQVSVFLESQPGHMKRVLDGFVEAGVNVRGFSASDTGDYGIARFIVDDPALASDVLRKAGCATTTTEVLCIRLEDAPGELARVLGILSDCDINVDYCYSLIKTYIAFYVHDLAAAEKILSEQPVELLSQIDLKNPIA